MQSWAQVPMGRTIDRENVPARLIPMNKVAMTRPSESVDESPHLSSVSLRCPSPLSC